jgi:sigma-B regulation protein RsbU (phosphoserine phosphatase)
VLPLAAKDKLLGVMALGPRRSEAPYTKRDLQWLDAAAVQAGVALANSRRAAQWAEDSVARRSSALP